MTSQGGDTRGAIVCDAHDVWVSQRRENARFGQELAAQYARIRAVPDIKHLYGMTRPKRSMNSGIDDGHPAASAFPYYFIWTKQTYRPAPRRLKINPP